MPNKSARTVALEVVTSVRTRSAYAHEVLGAALDRSSLSDRDRAFATHLAYGTISCRGTLDEAVQRFLSRPTSLEPQVADALAVSAFELLFSRSAQHAAVSEGVDLMKAVRPRAAGLANAVLRKLADAAADFPWGDPLTDDDALARLYGHPRWLAAQWIEELGRETATAIMAADNAPAPLYLAHLPFERGFEEVVDALERDGCEPQPLALGGCILAGNAARTVASSVLSRRDVVVCDAAAQFAAACVHPPADGHVVEIGAGRGTKSLIIAGRGRIDGAEPRITAIDTHGFKLAELDRVAGSLGVSGIKTCIADGTTLDAPCVPAPQSVDVVLIDAPCSGLGTLRRHPDRRWRAVPEECETLAALGLQLLTASANLVKPGGFVVYSTCTVSRMENTDVIAAFLSSETGAGFELDSLESDVPVEWTRWLAPSGMFQSLPEEGGPDGHFVARLRKVL